MVRMMRLMAKLAPRVLFSPLLDLQTRAVIPLVSPPTVSSVQQSLSRLHQSPPAPAAPAAPGFYKLEEKTEMTSLLQRPENRILYEKLNSGAAQSPLDTAGGMVFTFISTV